MLLRVNLNGLRNTAQRYRICIRVAVAQDVRKNVFILDIVIILYFLLQKKINM